MVRFTLSIVLFSTALLAQKVDTGFDHALDFTLKAKGLTEVLRGTVQESPSKKN